MTMSPWSSSRPSSLTVFSVGCPAGSITRTARAVEDHAAMSVSHQPPRQIGAHAAEPDHTELHEAWSSAQCVFGSGVELGQPGADVFHDMRAQHAAAAFGEDAKVPARLRGLDYAEGRLAAGNLQVERVLAGNLQEYPGVRPP